MAEEVKIHPGVVIGAGLLLGVGGILLYTLTARAAPAEPELGLATVYGQVKDETTDQPVPDVEVSLDGLRARTDSRGVYQFTNVVPGMYELAAATEDVIRFRETMNVVEGLIPRHFRIRLPSLMTILEGYVSDSETGEALANVWVSVDGIGANTDSMGYYCIEAVIVGDVIVEFRKYRYVSQRRKLTARLGRSYTLSISLTPVEY